MNSAIWNPRAKNSRDFWRVCNAISLCVGTMVLPAVAAADVTAWLCCREIGGAQCRQAMALSIAQSGLEELGALDTMEPVGVFILDPKP